MKLGAYELDTIYTGDCREILPLIPDNSFALSFADPPYWVNFDYGEKTDNEMDYIDPVWIINELLRISACVLVTPGMSHERQYPDNYIWK